jgi:hypothetical protein
LLGAASCLHGGDGNGNGNGNGDAKLRIAEGPPHAARKRTLLIDGVVPDSGLVHPLTRSVRLAEFHQLWLVRHSHWPAKLLC